MKLEADFSHLKGVCDSLAEPPQLPRRDEPLLNKVMTLERGRNCHLELSYLTHVISQAPSVSREYLSTVVAPPTPRYPQILFLTSSSPSSLANHLIDIIHIYITKRHLPFPQLPNAQSKRKQSILLQWRWVTPAGAIHLLASI